MTVTTSDRALIWQELERIDQSPPPLMAREVSSLRKEKDEMQSIADLFAGFICLGFVVGGFVTGYIADLDPWAVGTIVISACGGVGFYWGLLKSYSREAS